MIKSKMALFSQVEACPLPASSELASRVKGNDFIDCYCIEAEAEPREAAEIITSFPAWAEWLLKVRSAITSPFGLSQTGPDAADKVGIFPVESETDHEVIAGFNDKHLNFRVSIICEGGKVFLATWVHPHNVGGRIYLKTILPFHILIVRDSLVRVHRVVIVTGGASGMGEACVKEFVTRGAKVAILDQNKNGAQRVAGDCATLWDRPMVITGDVGRSKFCNSAVDKVVDTHGRLDVLVNAAGTIHRADSLGTSDDDWRRVMSVNIDGMFYLCRAALGPMTAAKSGSIVNFGSIWGGVGSAGSTAYCVSKGAVHQLTRALALDHVEQGIRVNAVAPGEVNTPMLASERSSPPSAEDLQALADATIPMKRLADPAEIAKVVVFLASDDASYMTGEVVHVDAGYTAR